MHIVFLGNCQVASLGQILSRFVAPYTGITTDFVDTFQNVVSTSYERLNRADVVVAQATSQPPPLDYSRIPNGVPVHWVPLVNGSFLYPYRGVVHPNNPIARYGNPPYQPEYNDRFLARLINANVSADDALLQYQAHDVAESGHVGRLYELAIEGQRILDDRTGYDCSRIIETYLPTEPLFQSGYHFGGRIGRHIAAELCNRIGFDPKYSARITNFLRESPFVPRYVPIHPSVAKHFGMRWVKEETRYPFLWEGAFTFNQYVLRFMQAHWSPTLQEGIIDAKRNEAGARAKLETGLQDAPLSAMGAHELSRILEHDGDLENALIWQRRAVANATYQPESADNTGFRLRLAALLRKAGKTDEAVRILRDATAADPINAHGWSALRNALLDCGLVTEAYQAALQVVEYEPNTEAAQNVLEKIRVRLDHSRRA